MECQNQQEGLLKHKCWTHLWWLSGKESTYSAGDLGLIPGSGRFPGEEDGMNTGQPIPVFWPGESHGQRSLAGYSPWGGRESDLTKVT